MKTHIIITLFISFLFFTSCEEEAHMEVTNKVHNVTLENVAFGDFPLGYKILPGESTGRILLSDNYSGISFPMTAQIKFYMVRGGNKVYLRTKESFTLKDGSNLKVEITDDTEVENMLTGTSMSLAAEFNE